MVNEVMKFIENYDPEVGKAIEQKPHAREEIWS